MATLIYKEKQRYNDKMTLSLLIIGTIAAVYGLVSTVFNNMEAGKAIAYTLIALSLGGILWFLRRLQLKVVVNDKKIKYKLAPLHDSSRKISWENVESCKIVKTPLLAPNHGSKHHFGGEKRLTFYGRNGLSIRTKDGQNFFIGVKDVDSLRSALKGHELLLEKA
ncbi:hypothetical protein [Neolewinella agarilytica]|uniref:PH domain-containing protein n=1 Tax=Neolewinella agarilytica TaxID=478744 RepID=A0A1H9EH05_9BACT|nr:hypothetical protein [Neolewinella agarilytica]SEQ25010.1 hypothetical protein SAMN05444359_10777 [Neolewinella agarilytica]